MIQHHPSLDVLTDYAAGRLSWSASLVVAGHLERCTLCRAEVQLWETVGGILLEETAPEPMTVEAWRGVLGRLDDAELTPRPTATPEFLRRFVLPAALDVRSIRKRLWPTPNIWFAPIDAAQGSSARTYLVYAKRNTTLPVHTHQGCEFTLVLHGSFSDDFGTFGPGDFETTDDAITHAPAVTGESGCLCLISAEAPMRLKGRFARAIQALTGTLY